MRTSPMNFNVEVIERDDDAAWAEWQDSVALQDSQHIPDPLKRASSRRGMADFGDPLALVVSKSAV
jgi:hypothetical protein